MAHSGSSFSGFSLIFDPGFRPDATTIAQHLAKDSDAAKAFTISFTPNPPQDWVELLSHGLTFDLTGLAPGEGKTLPDIAHAYGLAQSITQAITQGESVTIAPGRHLSGGQNLLPVVRAMADIALGLSRLPGLQAICWGAAQTALSPDYFRRAIGAWLDGGAFPALGLTALVRDPSGAMLSHGLSFFTGQELRIDPILARNPAAAGKIAIRLIHSLVSGWTVQSPEEIAGPEGQRLGVEPSANGREIRVWQVS
jgi:hypothetical protein